MRSSEFICSDDVVDSVAVVAVVVVVVLFIVDIAAVVGALVTVFLTATAYGQAPLVWR